MEWLAGWGDGPGRVAGLVWWLAGWGQWGLWLRCPNTLFKSIELTLSILKYQSFCVCLQFDIQIVFAFSFYYLRMLTPQPLLRSLSPFGTFGWPTFHRAAHFTSSLALPPPSSPQRQCLSRRCRRAASDRPPSLRLAGTGRGPGPRDPPQARVTGGCCGFCGCGGGGGGSSGRQWQLGCLIN